MTAAFLDEHVYGEDQVGFHSRRTHQLPSSEGLEGYVRAALDPNYPVVIVEHAEHESLKRNDTEIAILVPIIEAARGRLGLDPEDGLGVVVPHRAQRAALKALFPDLAEAGGIDTVERFQGGERDLIVVSATASDPEFVLAEASFLLNPNRLNVAISRPRKKLIVIGSTTIFRLVPPDMEVFESALLWKRLRYEFSADLLWEGEIDGVAARVSGRRVEDKSADTNMGEPRPGSKSDEESMQVRGSQLIGDTRPMITFEHDRGGRDTVFTLNHGQRARTGAAGTRCFRDISAQFSEHEALATAVRAIALMPEIDRETPGIRRPQVSKGEIALVTEAFLVAGGLSHKRAHELGQRVYRSGKGATVNLASEGFRPPSGS
jgi:hypothetical protein